MRSYFSSKISFFLGLFLLATPLGVQKALAQGTRGPLVDDTRVGYIDAALPLNMVRVRTDFSYNNPSPARAEFFWPFRGLHHQLEPRVDYQETLLYAETRLGERFSLFVESGIRWLNPTRNDNTSGLGDMNCGFKWAFVESDLLVTTFQFRTYVPTGDGDRGLGNNHVSLEPALLALAPLTDRWTAEAEARLWIPIGGDAVAGEIVRYGLGLSYSLFQDQDLWVAPVAEVVGWTILSGRSTRPDLQGNIGTRAAAGETIVNAKVGVRMGVGERCQVYGGYGRALTGEKWYADTLRLELRWGY